MKNPSDALIIADSSQRPVALVTGSSSGIGLAIALRMAADGFDCILHGGHSKQKLDQAVRQVREGGNEVVGMLADFTSPQTVEQFAGRAWNWKNRIDVLVNNAGADLLTQSTELPLPEKLQILVDVDVRATMTLSLQIGEFMKACSADHPVENGSFSICNIGWDQAEQGMEGESGVLFSTSKGAIMSMTRSLAQSLSPQVRVNCVAPGWIKTAWGESASEAWQQRAQQESLMNRWGTPDDIANAISFLSGPEARFINGQILKVNGGFRFRNTTGNDAG